MMKKISLLVIFLGAACGAIAQTSGATFQDQAARLQNINAYLLDFRANQAPLIPGKVTLSLGLDLNPQPSINARVGIKDEPLDPPSLVPKARARVAWPNGWMVGAAFAPGIEFQDYEAEYVSLESGYRLMWSDWILGLRVSYTDGDVIGPVTERDAEDEFTFETQAADITLARRFAPFSVYLFAGGVGTDTTLLIEEDGAFLTNDDSTYYGGVGLNYQFKSFDFNVEQNFTDDYLAHVTFSVGYAF